MIITIDGPAGSGKSTAARKLAAALDIAYLDTGAMYRAVTLAAIQREIDLQDTDALSRLARDVTIDLQCGPTHARVLLNGHDVSEAIRSADVSAKTSFVAKVAGVREAMVTQQRQIGRQLGSLVSEGRDQGSVVFPDADAKFFLDASPEVRARRRFDEMSVEGEDVTYDDVLNQIVTRDGADRSRAVAPLTVPNGAECLDTSGMTLSDVVDWLIGRVREKQSS